jgi:predicted nicotinamide N-methyase
LLQGGKELGTVVWRGAVLLCERLRKNPELVAAQRVLEVGAGCGVCSFLVRIGGGDLC